MKNFVEKEAWAYPGTAHFLGIPYYLRNGKSYGFQIWSVYSGGPSEQNPIKNFGQKGAWAYPGTAQFFSGTPYYLRNGKSYGFQIWPVHSEGPSEQKPIKNFREKGSWAYPGTAQFFGRPPIISGTGKATKFKFCMPIYRLNRNKSPLKISGNVAVGVVRDSRKFSGHPYIMAPIHNAHRAVIFAIAQLSCLLTVFF